MSRPRSLLVAEMTVRDLTRRRLAVAIMVLLPLSLFLVRQEAIGQSIRGLVFGISWTVSTIAFFAALSADQVAPRLALAGWPGRALVGGRMLGLLAMATVLCLGFFVLVAGVNPVDDLAGIALDFAVTALVAVAFGTAVGAVVHRELDGALVLFFVAALQAVANPAGSVAKAIPFWSSRELGTYAIDGPAAASIGPALVHALVVIAACATVIVVAHRGYRPYGRRQASMADGPTGSGDGAGSACF